ncbi:MAG TPA: hypothetical protein VH040_05150 [Usitatibacter sp.]|jgi:hypothetical protein|nr:hypothetical protein [Usitatibacter sp.]
MATLLASRSGSAWAVRATYSRAVPDAEASNRAALRAEAETWRLARELRRDRPWDIEYLHACLGPARTALGFALEAAEACERRAPMEMVIPDGAAQAALVRRFLSARGQAVAGVAWDALRERLRFVAAAALAGGALAAYVLRMALARRPAIAPGEADKGIALALHGEWTTRTRHLVGLEGLPVAFVVMLGRLKASPRAVAQEWSARTGGRTPPPWINPVSPRAALGAIPAMLALVREGFSSAPAHALPVAFREQVAMAFRVMLGAVQFRWWRDSGPRVATVLFGHTGNADTDALERAMQSRGARCVHVVHGLAAGANFAGFSDVAFFRAGFDARMYGELRQYGACEVIAAERPVLRRGSRGLFLLTNLAHPMNPRFALHGPADEIDLLEEVARIAPGLGCGSRPMRWRPHPVIDQLAGAVSTAIRRRSKELAFEETPRSEDAASVAARARWVFSSPSTVCVDLLAKGILTVVRDPQRTLADSSMNCFPGASEGGEALEALLRRLDADAAYADAFQRTWDEVAPAAPLDARSLAAALG